MKHYARKMYAVVSVQIHVFLTLALVGGEWSLSDNACPEYQSHSRDDTYTSQIYIPTIATDNLGLFYSVCSLHVSAPMGHLQVKHIIIIYIFMKTIIPQRTRYFTIIHLYGVHLLLSIYLLYNHIMVII
jgi:hypothetical protein